MNLKTCFMKKARHILYDFICTENSILTKSRSVVAWLRIRIGL